MPTRRILLAAAGATIVAMPRHSSAADGFVAVKPAGAPVAASPEQFTGAAEVSTPFAAEAPARSSGGTVRFAPSARTNWHTHPLGQTLLVLSGTGLVQRWGDPAQRLAPGDVAWIRPGTKHWHGAGPTEPLVHVAIGERLNDKTVDWLEPVSDIQYAEALRS